MANETTGRTSTCPECGFIYDSQHARCPKCGCLNPDASYGQIEAAPMPDLGSMQGKWGDTSRSSKARTGPIPAFIALTFFFLILLFVLVRAFADMRIARQDLSLYHQECGAAAKASASTPQSPATASQSPCIYEDGQATPRTQTGRKRGTRYYFDVVDANGESSTTQLSQDTGLPDGTTYKAALEVWDGDVTTVIIDGARYITEDNPGDRIPGDQETISTLEPICLVYGLILVGFAIYTDIRLRIARKKY